MGLYNREKYTAAICKQNLCKQFFEALLLWATPEVVVNAFGLLAGRLLAVVYILIS